MRVLLVNAHGADPTYGGTERYAHALARELQARGHHVEVLSAFPVPDEAGLPTHLLHDSDWRDSPTRRLRNHIGDVVAAPWPRVREVVEAAAPDLVHTNNLPGIGTGIWEIAGRLGLPVVHTLHDYHLLCPRTSLTRRDGRPCRPSPLLCGARTRRLGRWAGNVRVVIGVSEHVLRRHDGFFPAAAGRVIRHALTPLDGPPPGRPGSPVATVGYLGALSAVKGVPLLLEAAPALAAEGVALRIAGDGPLRAQVETAEAVHYAGRVERADLGAFIGECDAGVIPSLWEEPGAPPLVVCEWLAGGRPVLATQRGGLAEAARTGGILPFEASAAGFVEAAARLRDADGWRALLASVPAVEGTADVERWAAAHEEAYEIALRARAAAA